MAYSIVGDTLRKYQIAFEAGITSDEAPATVPLYRQAARGPITDAAAHDLLPGVPVPANVTIRVQYDAACTNAGCQSAMIQINHCKGEEYIQWVRFGDGFGLKLENISGEGCA